MAYEPVIDYTSGRRGMFYRLIHLDGARRKKVDDAIHEGRALEALKLAYTAERMVDALQVSLGRFRALNKGGTPSVEEAAKINHWSKRLLADLRRLDESTAVHHQIWLEMVKGRHSEEITFKLRLHTAMLEFNQFEVLVDCLSMDNSLRWTAFASSGIFKTEELALKGGGSALAHGAEMSPTLMAKWIVAGREVR